MRQSPPRKKSVKVQEFACQIQVKSAVHVAGCATQLTDVAQEGGSRLAILHFLLILCFPSSHTKETAR